MPEDRKINTEYYKDVIDIIDVIDHFIDNAYVLT